MFRLAHATHTQITPYFKEKVVQWPDNVVRLHIGEHPYGPSLHVIAGLQKDLQCLHHYPPPTYNALRQKIAEVHNLDPANIVCGNGSEELLHLVPKTFVSPGEHVVMPQYAFKGLPLGVLTCGGVPVYIPQDPENQCVFSADDVLSVVTTQTRMIMLDHPGNPTCHFLQRDEMRHVLSEANKGHILVVLDGAYSEYAMDCEGYALEDEWVQEFPNTIIMRNFSKAYALAALRLGWLHASPDVIDALYRLRLPYHVNTLAQKAGVYALEDQQYMQDCVRKVIALREPCLQFFKDQSPWRASTNFVVLKTDKDATWYGDGLLGEGILTRPLNDYDLPHHIKIAIGNEEDMQRLYQAWGRLDGKEKWPL